MTANKLWEVRVVLEEEKMGDHEYYTAGEIEEEIERVIVRGLRNFTATSLVKVKLLCTEASELIPEQNE
jgi:hypothetical protein